MSKIAILGTGLIYRNPKPHLHAIHAYFPSVVQLTNGELLCSLVLGEAFDAENCHTYVARSADRGRRGASRAASTPARPIASPRMRLASRRCPTAGAVAFMIRADRSAHPDEGLANPENLGFVPIETLLLWSEDAGHTWSLPEPFTPPLVGPSFEMCCPIVPLRDGRWFLPTSTWRGWDGYCPNGMKMVAFVSHDGGRSWPEYCDVMRDPQQKIIYWESKIVELTAERPHQGNGRLLAVAWAYDEVAGADLPNHYAVSDDGGKSWSAPASTGLQGQTPTPFGLDDGRVLMVYRRIDRPGLWANLSHLEGDRWVNDDEAPIWGAATNA